MGSVNFYGSLRLHEKIPDGLLEVSYIDHPDDPDDVLVTAGIAGYAFGEITKNLKKNDDQASGDGKDGRNKRASGTATGDVGNRSMLSIRFPGLGEVAEPMIKEYTAFIASRYFPGDYHGGTGADFADINLNDLDWPELWVSTAVLAEAKGSVTGKEGVASVGGSQGMWKAYGARVSGMDCGFGFAANYLSPSANYIADVARTVGDTIWTTLKGPDHWGSAGH